MLRKARVFGLLMMWPLVLGAAGCDCDNNNGPRMDMGGETDNGPIVTCCVNGAGVEICQDTPFCDSPFLCDQLEQPVAANDCRFIAPLDPGQLATHLDIASGTDTVVLSGYTAGRNPNPLYGDLVFGTVTDGEVTWAIVDGAPGGTPVVQGGIHPDPDGWRGGIIERGDNVGEWNAIALASDGTIRISYYDSTNTALKYAASSDGGATWAIHTVLDVANDGQYTSIAHLADGRPAISFLTLEPSSDPAVPVRSVVQVAIATSATPAADTDWVVMPVSAPTDVACVAALCEGDLVCRADGACAASSAAPTTDCSHLDGTGATVAGCGSGTSCVSDGTGANFTCQALSTGTPIEDLPIVDGLYTSLRATNTGLALVWYDRVRRTLRGSAFDSTAGTWRAPFAIDGFDAVGSGDAGYNADLFVAGNWYVAYVDGVSEELRLAVIDGSTLGNASPTITRETVDDGVRGTSPPHIVGADADVVVLGSGEVRVVYQDGTTQEALLAVRPAGSSTWTLQGGDGDPPLDSADSTGFWTCQSLSENTSQIATWWFNTTMGTNGTRVFSIP